MSQKLSKLNRHSVKSLLKETLLKTLEAIREQLNLFLTTHDPENLHQYRVNLRLARSVCLEFGAFMEKERKKILDEKLKILQKQTNELRDIDVFLESLNSYKPMESALSYADFVQIQKRLEHEKSECLRLFMSESEVLFREKTMVQLAKMHFDEKLCLPIAEGKLLVHVHEILHKRLKKIIKLSKKLSLETPNECFHKLRLQYKKLRYTADALNLTSFAKSFKPLQSAFGHVQDKNSQIERIKRYNTEKSSFLEDIIVQLEARLLVDKQVCIELSSKEKMENIEEKLEKIFTCKENKS